MTPQADDRCGENLANPQNAEFLKQLTNFMHVMTIVGGFEVFHKRMGVDTFLTVPRKASLASIPIHQTLDSMTIFVGDENHGGHFHFVPGDEQKENRAIVDPYRMRWQRDGSVGFCQIFALMGALSVDGLQPGELVHNMRVALHYLSHHVDEIRSVWSAALGLAAPCHFQGFDTKDQAIDENGENLIEFLRCASNEWFLERWIADENCYIYE